MIEIGEMISCGHFGYIFRGKDFTLGKLVAVKFIRTEQVDASDAIAHARSLSRVD
jgi:hypothetical protein